jgi:subtilisin family serine protease
VQLSEQPAAVYDGGTAGYAATRPAKGKKFDITSNAAQKYTAYLDGKHSDALARVGGGTRLYDYSVAYNGFAAKLTEAQARALEKAPGVLSVQQDVTNTVDTATTPHFLGLDAPNGLWAQLGGTGDKKDAGAGEGIIIGDVDSGITPESKSFTDRDADGKLVFQQIPGWHGKCTPGEQFNASLCNQKLIGAQYFNAGQGGDAGIDAGRPWEFNSVRDYNGHGTHTASTAAGNYGVQATGAAAAFGRTSGMAPRARIAAYKALWSTQDASQATGTGSDLVAAINQAVADGVDVINYSVSGTQTNFLDGAEIAFLNAAAANVFVATSAGNSGPGASTVAHPSPWLTTVAAESHDRVGAGSAVIDGVTYSGASAGTGSATGQLVVFGTPGSPDRLCQLNTLPPLAAAGKVVVCERGVNARVEKSFEVQRAGGIGMILVNPTANSLNADLHFVPSVHLQNTAYAAIVAAAVAGRTAAITGQVLFGQPAPFIADFSSRGPITAGGGDLLKPDVGAPGVDVLASVAPPGNRGRDFDLLSGTSMASPHVAGFAALLKQLHPDWSVTAIKSALMTSASQPLDVFADSATADPAALRAFAAGAAHAQPKGAADPGLVYDSGLADWLAFLCGSTSGVNPATCASLQAAGYSFDRSDMNLASIAIGDLAGSQTVKRRVTSVSRTTETYTASSSIAGVDVLVTPSSLTIAPGETKSFTVKFTRTSAALNKYVGGSLTWTSSSHSVRSPLAIRPVAFGSPTEIAGSGASGSVTYTTQSGYTGTLNYATRGLQAATKFDNHVGPDPTCTFDTANPDANVTAGKATVNSFTTPAGSNFIRFQTFQSDTSASGHDLDMFVYRAPAAPAPEVYALVLASGGPDANEVTSSTSAGSLQTGARFKVYVLGCNVDAGGADFTLFAWALTGSPSNPFTTSPSSQAVTTGQTIPTTFGWSGLPAGNRYLGRVQYQDSGAATIGTTQISVSTR